MATRVDTGPAVRVLLIDDDADDHFLTRDLLNGIPGGNYQLDCHTQYEAGLKAMCSGDYHVVLLDYKLGEKTGLDLLQAARTQGCAAPVIILTGLSDPDIDLAALQIGAADYVEKSRLDSTLLGRTISYAIRQRDTELDLERRVRERTEELDRANGTLRELDRRKDEFLATLAHELRNPLAPVRNALEVMRLSEGNPVALSTARSIIERQVAQLVRLIDDLLDVSRVTRGKLRFVMEPMTIGQAIEAAVEQSRPLLEKTRQTLTVDMPAEPIHLIGDRVRLAQVFANLLNNAAKYTESEGRVQIAVRCEAGHVIVSVRDEGVGIAAEHLAHIFEPFTQIENTLVRAQGGLGIGLSLVRSIVERHGGTVSASSDGPGRGAEFTVSLPIESK